MSREIVVVLPHDLSRDEARRRVVDAVERARTGFATGMVSAHVAWPAADHADIRVAALGQSVDAQIDVDDAQVRVRVVLPWFLERLAGPITERIARTGGDALKIGHTPKRA